MREDTVVDSGRETERRLTLRDESDIVAARRHVRELGRERGLSTLAIEALATAVSEIARNVIVHAGAGDMRLQGARAVRGGIERDLLIVVVGDGGPGIGDIDAAMVDGFSTGAGLGLGLPGARRMVDSFEIASVVGEGTTITLEKWAEPPRAYL
jgi:serine/threonine-protein kinase RsbT